MELKISCRNPPNSKILTYDWWEPLLPFLNRIVWARGCFDLMYRKFGSSIELLAHLDAIFYIHHFTVGSIPKKCSFFNNRYSYVKRQFWIPSFWKEIVVSRIHRFLLFLITTVFEKRNSWDSFSNLLFAANKLWNHYILQRQWHHLVWFFFHMSCWTINKKNATVARDPLESECHLANNLNVKNKIKSAKISQWKSRML